MPKKKKEEPHENLERWLVSYGDFITLLFATFVVLYALSQVDIADFTKFEESIRKAFEANALLTGQESILESNDKFFDETTMANSFIPSLMFEYMNAKYEDNSFQEIEKIVNQLVKNKELDGVSAKMTERGLLLTFDEQYLFPSGSAELSPSAKLMLDRVGVLVYEKFMLHNMRIEGHTDSTPIATNKYPSNWELSAARACSVVRYLIGRFKFFPQLFTAIGYADTRPVVKSNAPEDAQKNRRIEIMILKNKYKDAEKPGIDLKEIPIDEQKRLQAEREKIVRDVRHAINMQDFDSSQNYVPNKTENSNIIRYTKLPPKAADEKNRAVYQGLKNDLKTEDAIPVIMLDTPLPSDEDFGI